MSNFEQDYNALNDIINKYSSGDINGDQALNAGKKVTGNYLDNKPKRTFAEFLAQSGMKSAAADYINTVNDMKSVRGSNWVNVDIHNPDYMDTFYDRYRAFGSSTFDKLGFSPFRNNDAYYNEHTSSWDNHVRTIKTMPGMVWNMMKQTWFIGDENELARDYARRNAIAYDTREDGSFYNNMLLSSSATLGIMASLLAEKAVGIGITALTAGAGSGIMAAQAANDAKTMSVFSRIASKMNELNRLVKTTTGVERASTAGSKFAEIGKGLNPVKNITDFIGDVNAGALNGLKPIEKIRRGSFAAWADARTANLVYKESALEANLARDEFIDNMIKDFQDKNGRMPSGVEVDDIRARAASVKNSVIMGNLAAIYLTDKIMFNDLLDPVLTKTLKSGAGLKGGLMYDGKKFFTTTWKDWIPGKHFKAKLKSATGDLIDWSLGSVSEGLQENIQDVLADAAKSYYADFYNTDYGKNSFGEFLSFMLDNQYMPDAIRGQISDQGLETFLSGALMGGPITIGSKVLSKSAKAGMRAYDKSQLNKLQDKMDKAEKDNGVNSDEYKSAKSNYESALARFNNEYKNESSKKAADIFNNMLADPKQFDKFMDKAEHSAMLNRIVSNIYNGLGNKSSKDTEGDVDATIEYAFSLAMRMGAMDNIIEHYDDLIANAGEEYLKHGAESAEDFKENVKRARDKAESMKNLWETLDKKMPTQFHPENYKVGSEKWFTEMAGKKAEELVKQAAVFLNEDMRRMVEYETESLNDINDILSKLDIENKATFSTDVNIIMGKENIANEIATLKTQISGYESIGEGITAENQKRLDSLRKKLKGLEDIVDAIDIDSRATKAQEKYNTANTELEDLVKKQREAKKRLQDAKAQNDSGLVKDIKSEIKDLTQSIRDKRQSVKKLKRDYESIVGNVNAIPYKDARTHKSLKKEKLAQSIKAYLDWISSEHGVDSSVLNSGDETSIYNRILKIYDNKSNMDVVKTAIYQMFDPNAYKNSVRIVQEDRLNIIRNLFNIMIDAAKTFDRNNSTNELLNNLYDAGFWIDPKVLEDIKSGGTLEMPDVFYLRELLKKGGITDEDLNKGVPIVKGSEDYNKAVKILQAYCHQNKIKLTNIDIKDRKTQARDIDAKHSKDNRTYYELCDFFGLDPTKEEQTVSANDILSKITSDKNKFANSVQVAFAENLKRLLKKMGTDVTLTFKYGLENQVVVDGNNVYVDLRYASEDFNIGVVSAEDESNRMFSADYIILKGLFTVIAKDALDTDTEFSNNITSMREKSLEYLNLHGAYELDMEEGQSVTDFYTGLDNNEAFVIEAMLNPRFQKLLSEIQLDTETPGYNYNEQGKSVWERFIDAVVDFIRKYGSGIGVNNNNMLNTTIDIVTSKLEGIKWQPFVQQDEILPVDTESTPVRDSHTNDQLERLDPVGDDIANDPDYLRAIDAINSNDGVRADVLARFRELNGDTYDCDNDDDVINSAIMASYLTNPDSDIYNIISEINKQPEIPQVGEKFVSKNNPDRVFTVSKIVDKDGDVTVYLKKDMLSKAIGVSLATLYSDYTKYIEPPKNPTPSGETNDNDTKSLSDLTDDEIENITNSAYSDFISNMQNINSVDDVRDRLSNVFRSLGYDSIADDIESGEIPEAIYNDLSALIFSSYKPSAVTIILDNETGKYYKYKNGNILKDGKWVKYDGEYTSFDSHLAFIYAYQNSDVTKALNDSEITNSIKLSVKFFYSGEFTTNDLNNFVAENINMSEADLLEQLVKDRCK